MFLICRAAVNERGEQLLHVITRAKDNYTAYFPAKEEKNAFTEANKVHLRELFDYPAAFARTVLTLYGEEREILYCCVDLMWKPVNGMLRFVCVVDGDKRYVLMCSDLELGAKDIIRLYGFRWKIEVMFWLLKHLLGAFAYHFWTKALPKAGRKGHSGYDGLSAEQKAYCLQTAERIERFVNLAAIALGLIQYMAIKHPFEVWANYAGWMRTAPSGIPSEGVVQDAFRAEFYSLDREDRKVPNSGTSERVTQSADPPIPEFAT